MATVRKFLFLDPATGQYKEQTGLDTIQVADGVQNGDAVNKGQLTNVATTAANAVQAEADRAAAAETALQAAIDAEATRAMGIEASLASQLSSAIETFSAFDSQIAADLASEIARATAAEAAEATTRAAAVSSEKSRAEAAEAQLATDLASEISTRAAADSALSARLNTLEADDATINSVKYLIKQAKTALETALSAEESARVAGDSALAADLSNEVSARAAAISSLQSYVDSNIETLVAADVALGLRIDNEAAARDEAIGVATSAINAEASRAQGVEADLQGQIDNLSAGTASFEASIQAAVGAEASAREAGDAATLVSAKAYADGLTSGLSFKEAVQVAVPAVFTNDSGDTFNFPADAAALIAGASLSEGDRVLLTSNDGNVAAGIYVIAGGALVRTADMAVGSSAAGAYVYAEFAISSGDWAASNPGTAFVCFNAKGSDVVGTAALKWAIFSRAENLVFGGGLVKSEQNVSLAVKWDGGVEISSDGVKVKIKDSTHLGTDGSGLFVKGALVDGSSADAEHKHNVLSTAMGWGEKDAGFFYTAAGAVASWAAPKCVGFAVGDGSVLVTSGIVEKSAPAFAVDDVLYLDGDGNGFSTFASIPSGKYAIPVGKKISGTKILVQIGAPVLKA